MDESVTGIKKDASTNSHRHKETRQSVGRAAASLIVDWCLWDWWPTSSHQLGSPPLLSLENKEEKSSVVQIVSENTF